MTTFKPNIVLKAGNHLVSIGRETSFVAILSPYTYEFVKLSRAKTNKKLRKVKRELKNKLNSDESFTFEFMNDEQTTKLITILKSK